MLIHLDPDDYEVDSWHVTCQHHQQNPHDTSYAGCTCSSGYTQKKKKKPS